MSKAQITDGKPKRKKRGFLRLFLLLGFLGFIGLGVTYGLAKFGIVKLPQKPFLTPLYAKIGLNSPKLPTRVVASKPAPDPLAEERKKIVEQRESLQKEREEWDRQKQETAKREADTKSKERAQESTRKEALDPKGLSRMVAVYEEMPIEKVSKIFAILPDVQVIELLRRMDEKKVAELLATEKPARAARLSITISKASLQN